MMKKRMVFLMAVLMILGLSVPAFAADTTSYTDVPSTHWAYSSIESCASKGLMQGVGDNKFDPESNLTRAQVAQICHNAYKVKLPSMITNKMIVDVAGDAWYRDAMYWMMANGIVYGTVDEDGNTFCYPDATADRKYVALVLSRLAQTLSVELPKTNPAVVFPDIEALGDEYQKAIAALQQAGVIAGFPDGSYQPNGSLTRAQAAKLFDVFTDIEGLGIEAVGKPVVTEPPMSSETFLSKAIYDEIKPYAESLGYRCDSYSYPYSDSFEWSMSFSKGLTLVSMALVRNGDHWVCVAYESYGTGSPEKNIRVYSLDEMKALLERYAN